MPKDIFKKRKQDILSKKDKSHRGKWDEKILNLCKKINSFDCYYTTSSCSGRIVLIINKERKQSGLFLKVRHNLISFKDLKRDLKEIKNKEDIKFKMEPCALHVACKGFKDAKELCDKAKLAGWKKSGIISINKRFVVELNSTERLEFPIIKNGKLLVNDEFLREIVKQSNKKLKKCWKKIQKLNKFLSDQK